jgi:hypothetical protein
MSLVGKRYLLVTWVGRRADARHESIGGLGSI